MITYVFKPEFEEKLKKLKIKTKFLKNVQYDIKHITTLRKRCQVLNSYKLWYTFIDMAFDWTQTEEGYKCWINIAHN